MNILKLINHVRYYNQVFLPYELFGCNRRERTEACIDNYVKSQTWWAFYHYLVGKLTKKVFKVWRKFTK